MEESSPVSSPRGSDHSGELYTSGVSTVPVSVDLGVSGVPTSGGASLQARVSTGPGADMEALGVATNVLQPGVQLRLHGDHLLNQEFDREHLDRYGSGEPTLYFSTQSGGRGIKRTVELKKEAEGAEKKERVPDEERKKELKELFLEVKHTLGLGKEVVVVHLGIADGSLILEYPDPTDPDKKITAKYNLNDLGLFEPHGEIHHGGGLKQLFRDIYGIEMSRPALEKRNTKCSELLKKIGKTIKPETGGKLRGHYLLENRGNVQGHQAFHLPMSGGAAKIIRGEGWTPSTKLLEKFGYVDREKRTARSDQFSLNRNGKEATTDLFNAMQLQEILRHNLQAKIQQKQAEKGRLHPEDPADAESLRDVNADLEALKGVLTELNHTQPIAVTYPLMLLNKTFTVNVYEMGSDGSYERETDGRPKRIDRQIKGKDLLKPIPESDYHKFGISPGDHQEAARVHQEHLALFASKGEEILGELIDGGNMHRTFPKLWNKEVEKHPVDAQVKADMGGVVMQAGAIPSAEPTLDGIIRYAESHESGSKVAQESRMASFLVHTVKREGTTDTNYALREFNREPQVVRDVFDMSLRRFQQRRVSDVNGRGIPDKFTSGDWQKKEGPQLLQQARTHAHSNS